MPSRNSGRRSHAGCEECNVKCDEALPICRRCQRHSRACSRSGVPFFSDAVPSCITAPSSPASKKLVWREGYPPERRQSVVPEENRSCRKMVLEQPRTPASSSSDCKVRDWAPAGQSTQHVNSKEELYQHFLSATAYSLAQGEPVLLDLYQKTAPALAVDRSYLMDCLLGFSSHHRLFLLTRHPSTSTQTHSPSEIAALQTLALQYQCRALSTYSAQLDAASSVDDCAAVAIAGILLLLFSFANRQLTKQSMGPSSPWALPQTIEILRLQAGIGAVMGSKMDRILQSQLRPLLEFPRQDENAMLEQDTAASLSDFSALCSNGTLSETEKSLLSRVCAGLQETSRALSQDLRNVGNRLAWVRGTDASELADLLENRNPVCLVAASYWAVSIVAWPGAWWEMNLGRSLIGEVQAQLPAEFQSYMSWPLKRCGTENFNPEPARNS